MLNNLGFIKHAAVLCNKYIMTSKLCVYVYNLNKKIFLEPKRRFKVVTKNMFFLFFIVILQLLKKYKNFIYLVIIIFMKFY